MDELERSRELHLGLERLSEMLEATERIKDADNLVGVCFWRIVAAGVLLVIAISFAPVWVLGVLGAVLVITAIQLILAYRKLNQAMIHGTKVLQKLGNERR